MVYLILLFAGALLCNALPHLIAGVQGATFPTPWAKPPGVGHSSAVENVLWGSANLLPAIWLLDRTLAGNVPHGLIAVALGFVAMGVVSALIFGRRQGGGRT
jgi:hypothetical protein